LDSGKKTLRFQRIRDFVKYEFIGLEVEVIESKNEKLKGIFGKIVDETKNTFVLETESGKKVVPKKFCTFLFYFNDYWIRVDGKLICNRPWERIKQKIVKRI
jgi:ribonuclease P protein subunit POP4